MYAGLPGPPVFNLAGAEAFIAMNTPPMIGALDGFMGFANGQFAFRIGGLPGQGVILETSGNLRDWTALQTNVLGNVAIEFSDPGSGSLPRRFYRARLP